jgi:hypothetical protein
MVAGRGTIKDFDPTIRKSVSTGYIIVPTDVDRNKFITQCLRTERFSIFIEGNGGILHNCYITKSALQDIVFPLDGQQLGSAVVFFCEPFGGKAIITGVVSKNDETELNNEDILVFKKTKNGNYALLSVDGNGQVNIDIIGTATNGALNINVRNDDMSAKVNLHVKGSINVYSEGNTNITTIGGDINLVGNQGINIKVDGNINASAAKTLLDGANEAMVKGDELQTNLDKTNEVVKSIRSALMNWTPTPSDGGAALKLQVMQQLTGKVEGTFDKIKSEKSFLE